MFEATRAISSTQDTPPISVFQPDTEELALNDEDKADIVKNWFMEHYTGPEPPLDPFVGAAKPLDTPITAFEVEKAAKKLKNGKAVGPDNLPNEFLKYAPSSFYIKFASLINESFEKHEHVQSFTEGLLTPLQKPGKPKGPVKSLRPLCLLNGTRKILSMVTLQRIQQQIADYTGPWQNAYKSGHSCSNIVWTQRILISIVKEKRWEFSKMGIDMSSAFDTIHRSTILRLLQDAGCSEDDIKLVRYLLANTKLRIKINKTTSGEFEVTIGAFQGDCLSGSLFTMYLAGALYHLRAVVIHIRPNPPIAQSSLPLEWEYADDVDFADEDEDKLHQLLPICKEILSEWNLLVNETKTEFVKCYLAGKDEMDEKGEPIKNKEPWRKCVSLGSKLCSKEDVQHRMILGNVAFEKYKKVWMQGSKINLKTKIKIYEAYVTSVMLYNCNSWATPQNLFDKLDACHRKHLRQIIKMTHPFVISNIALYERCGVTPLSERVTYARWKMLGHVLRSDCSSPAQRALQFAVDAFNCMKGRVGRHQNNLFKFIVNDLNKRNLPLRDINDLYELRATASNRVLWRRLFSS